MLCTGVEDKIFHLPAAHLCLPSIFKITEVWRICFSAVLEATRESKDRQQMNKVSVERQKENQQTNKQ